MLVRAIVTLLLFAKHRDQLFQFRLTAFLSECGACCVVGEACEHERSRTYFFWFWFASRPALATAAACQCRAQVCV